MSGYCESTPALQQNLRTCDFTQEARMPASDLATTVALPFAGSRSRRAEQEAKRQSTLLLHEGMIHAMRIAAMPPEKQADALAFTVECTRENLIGDSWSEGDADFFLKKFEAAIHDWLGVPFH
jgi:hypothetical protein